MAFSFPLKVFLCFIGIACFATCHLEYLVPTSAYSLVFDPSLFYFLPNHDPSFGLFFVITHGQNISFLLSEETKILSLILLLHHLPVYRSCQTRTSSCMQQNLQRQTYQELAPRQFLLQRLKMRVWIGRVMLALLFFRHRSFSLFF